MGQQISMDAAFASYRDRATDLFHENVLLKAHVAELEAQLEQQPAAPAPSPDEQQSVPAASYLGDQQL
jgi:hypothetical protein